MRKVREILRQKLSLGLSHREVALHVGVSVGVVTKVFTRARAAGVDWPAAQALDEEALEVRLYGPRLSSTVARPKPDLAWIHIERKRPGVTLELLHLEYLEQHPDGYRYTQFCQHYRDWLKNRKLSMRQVHVAGEKLFVDYSGKKASIVCPRTGEVTEVELFVAVLGASNYTYAEATLTQQSVDFIQSHVRTYEFLNGAPAMTVPDQLKSGVTTSCIYDPKVQRTYEEMARHYGTAVFPARPRKPKDKAKVEVGVQVVQRWILARIRNEVFSSLERLNVRIAELLEDLNDRPMRNHGGKSRRELFEMLDAPALKPLPSERFAFAEWKHARVNIDYHVDVEGHLYSVPYTLVREQVEVRMTATTIEVFHASRRVASHVRSRKKGAFTTTKAHMPKAHQASIAWPPSRLIAWAAKTGPSTEALVRAILDEKPHPEQGYRSCLGILRLAKRFGDDRLDAACARAHVAGARSYRHVAAILKNNLDRMPVHDGSEETRTLPLHENVRGPGYYH